MSDLTLVQGHLSHIHKRTDEQDVGISPETEHVQETNHSPAKREFKESIITWFLTNQSYLSYYIILALPFNKYNLILRKHFLFLRL